MTQRANQNDVEGDEWTNHAGDVMSPHSHNARVNEVHCDSFIIFEGDAPKVFFDCVIYSVVEPFASHTLQHGMTSWPPFFIFSDATCNNNNNNNNNNSDLE